MATTTTAAGRQLIMNVGTATTGTEAATEHGTASAAKSAVAVSTAATRSPPAAAVTAGAGAANAGNTAAQLRARRTTGALRGVVAEELAGAPLPVAAAKVRRVRRGEGGRTGRGRWRYPRM